MFGSLKNSTTLPALRDIVANMASRQCAMPGPPFMGTTTSRLRKYEVVIGSISSPRPSQSSSAFGMSGWFLKP